MKPVLLLALLLPLAALAQETGEDEALRASGLNGVRPGGTLHQALPAPQMPREVTPVRRPVRNYPDQPPVIPHTVRGYQVTKEFNQCLTCHSRPGRPAHRRAAATTRSGARPLPRRPRRAGQSQPLWRAVRAASMRLRVPVLPMADDR